MVCLLTSFVPLMKDVTHATHIMIAVPERSATIAKWGGSSGEDQKSLAFATANRLPVVACSTMMANGVAIIASHFTIALSLSVASPRVIFRA